jgi:hypothetical protein
VLEKRMMCHYAEIVPSIELRRDLLEMSLSSNPAVTTDENLASSWLLTSFPALHSKDAHMFSIQKVQVALFKLFIQQNKLQLSVPITL